MSENIRNHEVDDVLASVRRIVARSAAEGADVTTSRQTTLEKLLLTPSLRVEGEIEAPRSVQTRVTTRTLSSERSTLEQRIAELERTISPDGNWEPDGSEDSEQETPRRFPMLGVREQSEASPPLNLATFRSERRAEVENVSAIDGPHDAEELPARLHLGEAQEDAEVSPVAELPEPGPTEAPAAPAPQGLDHVDEETLRRIVAEAVRAELQGELGERITRNVRKLVRREIYRAIMAREFSG